MATLLESTNILISNVEFSSNKVNQAHSSLLKAIGQVEENDIVQGAYGSPGIVSDDILLRVISDENVGIYGINEDKPFFTAAQVFWTNRGWKAISPDLAGKNNSKLLIRPLEAGDVVFVAISSKNGFSYQPKQIKTFTSTKLPTGALLRGIHIREGTKSFHANGYLVSNNEAEFTSVSLTRNLMSRTTVAKRTELFEEIEKPLWTRILGPGVVTAVKHSYFSTEKSNPSRKSKRNTPEKDVLHSRHVKKLLMTCPGGDGLKSLPEISLVRGEILRDHEPVDMGSIDGTNIFWRKNISNRDVEYGAARMDLSGLFGDVCIQRGSDIMKGKLTTGEKIYEVANGEKTPIELAIKISDNGFQSKGSVESKENAKYGDLTITTSHVSGVTSVQGVLLESSPFPGNTLTGTLSENLKYIHGHISGKGGSSISIICELKSVNWKQNANGYRNMKELKEKVPKTTWITKNQEGKHDKSFARQLSTAQVPRLPLSLPASSFVEARDGLEHAFELLPSV